MHVEPSCTKIDFADFKDMKIHFTVVFLGIFLHCVHCNAMHGAVHKPKLVLCRAQI